ncbi:protein disulfide oxidoreductase [Caldivirga maquilingensis]|uniref:Glutaredoxin-like domain protein n=1 Tax=Caldivirga maquilingensis (strain ATCC 700844 / DSM 13496 / JCM 10307 / IC-167) TaxID=397948 RepID=A8M8V0_CALMQ|nr:thioredoxin family protein [Caldivirga maquilingensis]ABW02169.1 glutaredoxin-like domain protein [Caldivirga maquilingensis IC-167]
MSATPLAPPTGPEEVHIEVDEETKGIIREMLSQMVNPVTFDLFTTGNCAGRDTNWCTPTEELLDLLSSLAPEGKLIVNKHRLDQNKDDGAKFNVEENRVPVIYINGGIIRYFGAPLGEEVRAFIETITRISTGKTGLRARTKSTLASMINSDAKTVEVVTVVTPSCPYCPYAVLLANMFAYESKGKVRSVVVEAYEEPDIADMYGVTAVPTVVIRNEGSTGDVEFVGVPPEADLLKKVLSYSGFNPPGQ